MFETMSIYSLVLMLSAALLFPPAFQHLLGAPRAVLQRTTWNLWAVTLPFAGLCWFLAGFWAQASRPLGTSFAAVIALLVLLSLVFAFLPVKPRAGLGRHSLTLVVLVAYAAVCWMYNSLFAAVSGATFDTQALMFGYLLLCPVLTAALLPQPRPIATGMFMVLTALLLYAVGIWATSASWGMMPTLPQPIQPVIVIMFSLLMLAVLAWMVWQARDTQVARCFGAYLLAVSQRLVAIVWGIGWIVVHIVLDLAKGLLLLALLPLGAGVGIVVVLIPSLGEAVARGSVVLFQILWRGIKAIPVLFWDITIGIGNGLVNALIWFVSVPILGLGRGIIAIGDGLWRGLRRTFRGLVRAVVWFATFALPSLKHGLVALAGAIAGSLMGLGRILVHVIVASPRACWRAAVWLIADLLPGIGQKLLAVLLAVLHGISVMARGIWHGLGALIRGLGRGICAFATGLLTLLVALVSGSFSAVVWLMTALVPAIARGVIAAVQWVAGSSLRLVRGIWHGLVQVAVALWHACLWLVTILIPGIGRALWHGLLVLAHSLVYAGTWLVTVALPGIGKGFWAMLRAIEQGMLAIIRGITYGLAATARGLDRLSVAAAGAVRYVCVWFLTTIIAAFAQGIVRFSRGLANLLIRLARGSWRVAVWLVVVLPPAILRAIPALARMVWRGLLAFGHSLIQAAVWVLKVAMLCIALCLMTPVYWAWRGGVWLVTFLLPTIGRGLVALLVGLALGSWRALLAMARGLTRALIWLVAIAPVIAVRKMLAAARTGLSWSIGLARGLGRALLWTATRLLRGIPRLLWIILRRIAQAIGDVVYGLGTGLASILAAGQRIITVVRSNLGIVMRTLTRISAVVVPTFALALVILLGAPTAWSYIHDWIWPPPAPSLHIVGGSNLKSLEPILQRWGSENQVGIQVAYRGSLDIQSSLEYGDNQYDAVWQGDSLWTTIGDTRGLLKDSQSIMCSPVVLGVKKSAASRLGWVDERQVRLREILDTAEGSKLRMFMASPAKSNSGALAYLAFLNAFDFDPNRATRLLRRVERTGDSSGWLRDTCRDQYGQCDVMINYESLILEMNQEMVTRGQEPMYIVYPAEGFGLADFPLSFVKTGNAEKESLFLRLQSYLRSDVVQNEIAGLGNRVGERCDHVNDTIFKPEWGADLTRTTESVRHPEKSVIDQALNEYQQTFRKPSFTIYLLDFSTSMQGSRRSYLQTAMSMVLDQKEAAKFKLQGTSDDATIVIPFAGRILTDEDLRSWTVSGSDAEEFNSLLKKIQSQPTADMTNIYTPVAKALYLMKEEDIGNYMPAIILLTDGESNRGTIEEVKQALQETGLYNVPIFGITFGDASQQQLNELAGLTGGRVFDGTKDLVEAFRQAKGQN